MSVKQISFSPELLDTPEVKSFDVPSCDLTASTDFSQIDFTPNSDGNMGTELLSRSIPSQFGGGELSGQEDDPELTPLDFSNLKIKKQEGPPDRSTVSTHNESENSTGNSDSDDISGTDESDKSENNKMSGGGFDVENMDVEVSDDEITNNPDNPGEDPEQSDDAIDENDREMEEDGKSISDRMEEIRKIDIEMRSEENQELLKELENTKLSELDFDLELLSKKLEYEMDLFWDKNLDISYVEKKVDEYISNYESKEYETYRKMLMYVLTKTKIGYKLTIDKNGVYILHRGNVDNYDIKLTPPKYIDISRGTLELNKDIKEISFKLYDLKSNLVDNAEKIMDEDLNEFRKLQKSYYSMIHKKAVYEAYHKKINGRGDDEIEMFLNFTKKNSNFRSDVGQIINTKYVKAPLSFQDNIQQVKISSLNLFNEIRQKFEKSKIEKHKFSKDEQKEIKNLIKKYLSTGNASSMIQMIEQFHAKQKKMVNIIIDKKPIIDVKSKNNKKSKTKGKK